MKGTELAKPIIEWLVDQHWEIYQEVQLDRSGSVADIVAVHNNICWIIETKTSYGLSVLNQATRRAAHFRSVAIPFSREPRDFKVALYYYQVGVIEVEGDHVDERIPAPFIRLNHKYAKRILNELLEIQKTYAPAGSSGRQHLTPYKYTMMQVREVIEANPGCTIKFLFETLGRMHYSSNSSFKGNLVKALVDFERDWCKVDMISRPYKLFVKEV